MRVTVLKEIPEDPHLSRAWNDLVLAMNNPEIFLTYQWALAVSRGFHNLLSPLLFLIYDSDELAGVAALAIDPKSPRTAFFLCASTSDYCDILSAPANRKAVILALLEEIDKLGLSHLVLANVPSNSATLQELAGLGGLRGFYATTRPAYDCSVVELGHGTQRATLLQTLAGKGREKRALKRLTNLGAVKVVHATEPEQIGTSVKAIVSAQISRFLAGNRVSPLVAPERRAFLHHLSDLLSPCGWLKISQLEIDGRPVAWNYGFRFGGSWFWYLPTFQMEFEQVSPGSCLLRLLVEEGAQDSSLRWLDLGLGDEPYKKRFTNKIRQTRHVHMSRGFPRHVVSTGRELVTRAAIRFPRLADKLRGGRAFCQTLASRVRQDGVTHAVRQLTRKARRLFASQDEVLLFEALESHAPDHPAVRLLPLTQERVVEASIINAGDAHTMRYLMRCARRLTQTGSSGFLLQDEAGRAIHFLWVDNYAGFYLSEIDYRLESSSETAAMIFDCWTPAADRGHGHYATALHQIVEKLNREHRTAWIFSGANNVASLQGILKAGFAYQFSLVRRCILGRAVVTRHPTTTAISLTATHLISPRIPTKHRSDVA